MVADRILRFMLSFCLTGLVLFSPSIVLADSAMDLELNYVQGKPVKGQFQYDVSAYFSFLDSAGVPVSDLTMDSVFVSEDGQTVKLTSLEPVNEEPIYISLLLDNSGSMGTSKMGEAREAANSFIAGLSENDKISVTTFNSEIKQSIDFTTDHSAAQNQIKLIESVPNSGTCFYDAVYQSVQKISALPLGRRAIIVLTDGKDELLSGGACSTLTIEDDIDLASSGTTRVPIYTIGLGNSVDPASLKRLSSLTGGRYAFSSDGDQLDATFKNLLNQLKSEYVAHYVSTAAPGTHTLVVQANYLGASAQDSRSFVLPEFPLTVSIISPAPDQEINGSEKIVVVVTGQGQAIKQVVFKANDQVIGTATQSPYEIDWLPDSNLHGEAVISVSVLGTNGEDLADNSIKVAVNQSTQSTPTITSSSTFQFLQNKLILYGGIALLALVVGLLFFWAFNKRRKSLNEKGQRLQDERGESGAGRNVMEDQTIDGFVMSENALGAITVMQSDDPTILGKRFEILEQTTRLGRAAENDLLFPKDGAVSRHHAIIENRSGQLILSEMVTVTGDGTTKPPTYGTYINDQKVVDPTPLRNGDLIRLGKRLVLRFETSMKSDEDSEKTIDQLDITDLDKTMDSF